MKLMYFIFRFKDVDCFLFCFINFDIEFFQRLETSFIRHPLIVSFDVKKTKQTNYVTMIIKKIVEMDV